MINRRSWLRPLLLACTLGVQGLVGCSGGDNEAPSYLGQIIVQPSDQTVSVGQPATFSVTASGNPASYRWYRGTDLVGTNGPTYTTPPVVQADDGFLYSVWVSYNVPDMVSPPRISRSAKLTVLPGFVPVAGTFQDTGSMIAPRSGHTATLLRDGRVLIFGGTSNGKTDLPAEIYNPASGSFSSVGPPRAPRVGHSATLLSDGKVLIAGGTNGSTLAAQATAELFEPASNTFTQIAPMTVARARHTATLLADGRVLLAAGDDQNPGVVVLTSAELFDPTSRSFSTTKSMVDSISNPQAVELSNGKVLLTGSQQYLPVPANIYDPMTAAWSRITIGAPAPHYLRTAVGLSDGSILLVGGRSSVDNTFLLNALRFDPSTGTVLSQPAQVFARQNHSSTRLPSGRVLVVGGIGVGGRYPNRAELYDPASDSFSVTGGVIAERGSHSATLLANGSVLIAGGHADGREVGTALLFKP